ncbi:MAG: redoxin domain-containing protein [Myxococcales bacterium]|nr:MAG: redoxin domain-containing protein [Myxococcales bacterium]
MSGCASAAGISHVALSPPPPEVVALRNLDGGAAKLGDIIKNHEATVLIWWATQCPCVARYEERMTALRRSYPENRIAILAVASNADDDSLSIKKTLKERGFHLPLIIDSHAKLATLLGVRSTPTVVILERSGKVRFIGWMDNERSPGETDRIPYVQLTLDAMLGEAKESTQNRTPVYGCIITRSLLEKNTCHSVKKKCTYGHEPNQ